MLGKNTWLKSKCPRNLDLSILFSILPSFACSGFLRIDPLAFSETQHGVRGPPTMVKNDPKLAILELFVELYH